MLHSKLFPIFRENLPLLLLLRDKDLDLLILFLEVVQVLDFILDLSDLLETDFHNAFIFGCFIAHLLDLVRQLRDPLLQDQLLFLLLQLLLILQLQLLLLKLQYLMLERLVNRFDIFRQRFGNTLLGFRCQLLR